MKRLARAYCVCHSVAVTTIANKTIKPIVTFTVVWSCEGKIIKKKMAHPFSGDQFKSLKPNVICLQLFQQNSPHINLLKWWMHMPKPVIPHLKQSLIIPIHYSLATHSHYSLQYMKLQYILQYLVCKWHLSLKWNV